MKINTESQSKLTRTLAQVTKSKSETSTDTHARTPATHVHKNKVERSRSMGNNNSNSVKRALSRHTAAAVLTCSPTLSYALQNYQQGLRAAMWAVVDVCVCLCCVLLLLVLCAHVFFLRTFSICILKINNAGTTHQYKHTHIYAICELRVVAIGNARMFLVLLCKQYTSSIFFFLL